MKMGWEYKQIAVNTLYQFGAKILSVLLSLTSVGLLTRYLGTEQYGWFTMVFTYVSFFATLADLGYNQAIVREFSNWQSQKTDEYATYFNFKLILIACSIVLALVGLLVFPYDQFLKTAILIGIAAVAVSNLGSYGTSILQSQLRLDQVAFIDICTKIVNVILIVIGVRLELHLYFIISTVLIGNVVGLCIEYVLVKPWIVFAWSLHTDSIKRIMRISVPVGVTAILSLLYFKVDTLMLSVMRTPAEVGIYGLAYKVLDNILMLWAMYMASVFPLMSMFFASQSVEKYRKLLSRTTGFAVILSVCLIIGGYLFAPLVMRALGGSKFFSSMEPFKILLWSVPFLFLNNIFYNVILSLGKTRYLLIPLTISFLVSVSMNLFAIPAYGYIGASYVTVMTEMCMFIIYMYLLASKFRVFAPYLRISL